MYAPSITPVTKQMVRFRCEVDFDVKADSSQPKRIFSDREFYYQRDIRRNFLQLYRRPSSIGRTTSIFTKNTTSDYARDFYIRQVPAFSQNSIVISISNLDGLDIYELERRPQPKISVVPVEGTLTAIKSATNAPRPQIDSGDALKIKMFINRNIGQVCDSWSQISRISREILSFCNTQKSKGTMYVSFVFDVICSKLIDYAETQCALHRPSCFPLAIIVIILSNSLPEFKDFFISTVTKRCQFINHAWPSQILASGMGDLNVEKQCGIVAFFAAVLQYSIKNVSMPFTSPFDIRDAWRYLASMANSPASVYTSAVLLAFLEVSWYALFLSFGSNFKKLITTIRSGLVSKLPKQSHSSNQALILLLDFILKTTTPEPPKGMIVSE